MKPKTIIKIAVDLAMTLLLFCLMAYLLVGETVHEWLGVSMFALFILHHALNRNWHSNLTKGRYSPLRIFQTLLNILLLAAMVSLMISGIMLSREVFAFLPISGGTGFARTLHMLGGYWGFLLMSLHLGLHWGMVMGMLRKALHISKPNAVRTGLLRIVTVFVCAFGIYAFVKNDIASYLFLKTRFVFFDLEQPLILFFAEYLGMMALWAATAYYIGKLLRHCEKGGPR